MITHVWSLRHLRRILFFDPWLRTKPTATKDMQLLQLFCGAAIVSALQTPARQLRQPTRLAASFLESFAEAFANPALSVPKARPQAADELQDAVVAGWNGASVDGDRCSKLIDALAAVGGPFEASDLGGGLWLALHSRGPVPKWQKNQELLKVFGVKNRAGQTYFPDDQRVLNYGEAVGGLVTFGAEGTFELPAGRLRAPCDLPVQIASGGLTIFGRRFDLPIAGPGLVRVLYHDASMRIFESPDESQDKWEESGLVVVQVRESVIYS